MEKNLGDRLREERERLTLNQDEMADAGGVKRNSQGNYERGKQNPDTAYLLAVAEVGVDIHYVLTGSRLAAASHLADDERMVLEHFRRLDTADKAAVVRLVLALAALPSAGDEQ